MIALLLFGHLSCKLLCRERIYVCLQGEVVVEASGKDSSLSLKRRHYNAHRSNLTYGGFLESTCTEHCRDDGGVVITSSSNGVETQDSREAEWKEEEKEGGIGITDDSLFKACGGRTAHK